MTTESPPRFGPSAAPETPTRLYVLLKRRFGTIKEAAQNIGVSHDTLAALSRYPPSRVPTDRVVAALQKTFRQPFTALIAKSDRSQIQ